jgi:hypothetical protein
VRVAEAMTEIFQVGYIMSSNPSVTQPGWIGKHVGIYFSGSNHYTSAGIVVRTTKINSNIKEAKC